MGKTITFRISDELHKKFKIYALNHDTDMSSILIKHIEELLAEEENKEDSK